MNLFWIGIGMFGVIQFGAALAESFKHAFKAITIIGNLDTGSVSFHRMSSE